MSEALVPFRLKPFFSPRPWGRTSLAPWYSPAQTGTTELIGEAWLTGPQCLADSGPLAGRTLASIAAAHPSGLLGTHAAAAAQPAEFPLLVKLLLPTDKLSVQVHPDDAHALALGQPRGKTECWYVLSADSGAQIALGFNPAYPEQVSPTSIRAAIAAGTLEDLLNWVPVAAGDMFFVDAGTVHAIGPGMVLLETQQTCDTTFRMYDYGRPRELHVDDALRVMKVHTAAGKVQPRKVRSIQNDSAPEFTRLIQQQYFTVDRYDLAPNASVTLPAGKPGCLVLLTGSGSLASANSHSSLDLLRGHAAILPAATGGLTIHSPTGAALVHSWAP